MGMVTTLHIVKGLERTDTLTRYLETIFRKGLLSTICAGTELVLTQNTLSQLQIGKTYLGALAQLQPIAEKQNVLRDIV